MSWGYSTAPQNLTEQDVRRLARQEAINSIQSQSITGSMVPRSIPQITVDIPIRTDLPKAPEDGQEVYLRIGDGDSVAHMLYLASLPGWVQTGQPPLVTSLPTAAFDGMRIDYVADSTNGVTWSFRYRSAGSASYPWEFVGGPPLTARVDTDQSTASGTFAALATAGPSVTVPLAGDYIVRGQSNSYNSGIATNQHSYDLGGTGAVTANAGQAAIAAANYSAMLPFENRHDGLTAATAIVSKYATTAGTANFRYRWISVLPVRVGA